MATQLPQVLYVEDDLVNRILMEEIFVLAEDMQLIIVENGAEALNLAASEDIDVVITDIQLPGTNGYEILEALRSLPRTHEVPVIALSALAMRSDLERGATAGFAAYITKPMDIGSMIATVRDCCTAAAA